MIDISKVTIKNAERVRKETNMAKKKSEDAQKAAGIESGSGEPNKTKVAKVTSEQIRKIAETKMPDLNAASLEAAMSMIEGTCRSMGVEVVE